MTSSNLPARATAAQQNFPELAPNVEEAIRFMTWLAPHGPWHIYTIDAEGGAPVPMPFDFGPATNLEKCAVWIEQRNVARQNVYYSPNRPRAGVRKKASKEEMDVALWAYVDIDPCAGESLESEQKRILDLLQEERPASVPEPSAIVFSGGGYQVLLRLDQSIALTDAEKIEAYEARNRGLEDLLGGDNCHNCDRILRVPGTVNWPNKPKREKGRTPALAHVVGELSDVVVKITDLPKATNPLKPAVQSSSALEASPIRDIDELDRWNVPQRIKAIIETGPDARHPKKRDNSRSAWQLDATCQLVRSGIPDDTVMGILLDERWAIAATVLDKGHGAQKYARRQVARAVEFVALDAAEFQRDADNNLLKNQHNLRVAIHRLGVSLSYNTFHDRFIVDGLAGFGPVIDDAAMIRLRLAIDQTFKWLPAKEFFEDVMKDTARKNCFHPVRDYLDELVWDGVPRLDRWLSTYFGAKDTSYTNAVGRLWLIAAVRRVREPGCKFDEMIVLESDQGKDKSTALAVLAVKEEWFTDNLPLNADPARTIESISGRWIIEVAELQGGRKSEVEHVKAMLSRRIDRARLAYGRLPSEYPRQCVFAGTTNNQKYLRDQTGNRRFWPVAIGKIDVEQLKRARDQLWAEAAVLEAKGESIRLNPSLWKEAAVEQDQRREDDPFLMSLSEYLGNHTGKIRVTEVFELLGLPMHMRTTDQNTRVGMAMKALGWDHVQRRFGGNPEWAYVKGTQEERQRQLSVVIADGKRYLTSDRAVATDDETAKLLPF